MATGRLGSVRVRTTIAAVVVVGSALVIAAVAMVRLMDRSLTTNVRTLADDRAHVIAVALAGGRPADLSAGEADDEFVQILDRRGAVVDASANVRGRPAIAPGTVTGVGLPKAPTADFLVVSVAASAEGAERSVVVGRSLDDVREATDTAAGLLLVGVPILLLVVGAVTWWITGRARRPGESLRSEVESISAGELSRRIDEPGTGDEISRLASTLNLMLSRLDSAQRRQRRFVSDAAHELRSPVAALRQHAEVALEHPEITRSEELALVVRDEGLRLQHLVDDLLLLTRLDEGVGGPTELVDLDDLVLAEAARIRSAASLEVITDGVGAGRVAGRHAELARVVRNLADNAARHARRTVSFSLTDGGDGVVLDVDDDGPGVPPDDRDRVFERFIRLDDARATDDGGSGLGLAIVSDVTRAHRGTVELTGSPMGGARVRLAFPAVLSDGLTEPSPPQLPRIGG